MTQKNIFKLLLINGQLNIKEIKDMSLRDIIRFIIDYSEKEVIQYSDGVISITEYGVTFLMKNRREIFMKKTEKEWEKIPDEYLGKHIEIGELIQLQLKGV